MRQALNLDVHRSYKVGNNPIIIQLNMDKYGSNTPICIYIGVGIIIHLLTLRHPQAGVGNDPLKWVIQS